MNDIDTNDCIKQFWSSLFEAVFFTFIEQVCFCTTEVHNLWATISLKWRKERVILKKSPQVRLGEDKILKSKQRFSSDLPLCMLGKFSWFCCRLLTFFKIIFFKQEGQDFVLFCCFTSQVNSYGHCETVSSPNHTFFLSKLEQAFNQ